MWKISLRSSHPFISETGTAKRYANKLVGMFSNSFNVHLLGTDSFDPSSGLKGMNIFITSTFGNGDPPTMAQKLTGTRPLKPWFLKLYRSYFVLVSWGIEYFLCSILKMTQIPISLGG